MKKAAIIYQSKTGITRKFGEEISRYLSVKGIETQTFSVSDYKNGIIEQSDYVLLGCWTAGFMLLFFQHPDKIWKRFAQELPGLGGKKVALFTTYKIATGSMFNSMRKYLADKGTDLSLELKSRKGDLSLENKTILDRFLEN
jgi:flavodoxin